MRSEAAARFRAAAELHASAGPGAVLLASRPCQRSAPAAVVPDGPVQRRFQGQSVSCVSAALRQRERGLWVRSVRLRRPGLWRSACARAACGAAFRPRRRFVGFAIEWTRAAPAAESVEFQRRGHSAVGRDFGDSKALQPQGRVGRRLRRSRQTGRFFPA